MIDHLPAHSHFIAALAQDDEAAKQADPDAAPRPPSLTEHDPVVRAIAALYDRTGELLRATIASAGASPPKMQPYPRPVTAIDRARTRARWAKHNALADRVLRRTS